jgi:hypothetical protein
MNGGLLMGFSCTAHESLSLQTDRADLQLPAHEMGMEQTNDTWHQSKALTTGFNGKKLCGSKVHMGQRT